MTLYPTPDECLTILKKVGCSEPVINHCLAVKEVAIKIAKLAKADIKLVEIGALLHDIGRSKTHDITHGLEGAKIAKKLGLPVSIVNIIERHIGAGIPVDEAEKLGLPKRDFIPVTLEEKIVCHADSLIDNNKKQKIKNEINKARSSGHETYALRLEKMHQELSQICGMDLDNI